jgi:hypothetical protein
MSIPMRRGALVGALVVLATALSAHGAPAAVTPSMSLDQSAGTQAGAFQDLGLDLKFNTAGTYPVPDSPQHLTIMLPPGLLANADINGGACLTTTALNDSCQVGSGTVTAYAPSGLVPLPVNVTFDLVQPPAPGDLAGLAVNDNGTQIGSTAGITVRPSSDPNGVGLSISFVLPNNLYGIPINITEINSTFQALRYPTTCPGNPAPVLVQVDSYADPTVHTLSAPLNVTDCASLPYAPQLAVSATKDGGDRVVSLTTSVTQAADESPTRSLTLSFPGKALGVNLMAVKLLCVNLSSNCTPVGTATAVSPLYPTPLTASAYLTGTALGPQLTLVFPAPFPLTLTGSVTLTTKTATFTGLPDIPLTSLKLVLNGGADGLFLTNCNPGNGVADGTSTDQQGDHTVSASVPFDISGCPASSYTATSNTGPSTGGAGSGPSTPPAYNAAPTVTSPAMVDARSERPSLSFRVNERKGAAKLTQISVRLTPGISFVATRVGRRTRIMGVSLSGARIRSLAISHGRLIIRLRRPARSFRVRLTSVLHEDAALAAAVAHRHRVSVHLSLIAWNTAHKRHTVNRRIRV